MSDQRGRAWLRKLEADPGDLDEETAKRLFQLAFARLSMEGVMVGTFELLPQKDVRLVASRSIEAVQGDDAGEALREIAAAALGRTAGGGWELDPGALEIFALWSQDLVQGADNVVREYGRVGRASGAIVWRDHVCEGCEDCERARNPPGNPQGWICGGLTVIESVGATNLTSGGTYLSEQLACSLCGSASRTITLSPVEGACPECGTGNRA